MVPFSVPTLSGNVPELVGPLMGSVVLDGTLVVLSLEDVHV